MAPPRHDADNRPSDHDLEAMLERAAAEGVRRALSDVGLGGVDALGLMLRIEVHLAVAAPNARWSVDFVHDQRADGRRLRILNVVDDVTKECIAAVVDTSISGRRVARELAALVARGGRPELIVSHHETGFTSSAMLEWTKKAGSPDLIDDRSSVLWRPVGLIAAHARLPEAAAKAWRSRRLPAPAPRRVTLEAVLDHQAAEANSRSAAEVRALLALMADDHRTKVAAAQAAGDPTVEAVYRRPASDPAAPSASAPRCALTASPAAPHARRPVKLPDHPPGGGRPASCAPAVRERGGIADGVPRHLRAADAIQRRLQTRGRRRGRAGRQASAGESVGGGRHCAAGLLSGRPPRGVPPDYR